MDGVLSETANFSYLNCVSVINLLHYLHLSESSARKGHMFKFMDADCGITFANQYMRRLGLAHDILGIHR